MARGSLISQPVWTTRFGRGYWLVIRQTAERILSEVTVSFLASDFCIRLVT